MRVLVTGAQGFIGRQICTALRSAGHDLVLAVRASNIQESSDLDVTGIDYSVDHSVQAWLPRLSNIDAVVNCAGILREKGRQTFEAVHVKAPVALYEACAKAGVGKVIQISALGDPRDSQFIASKYLGDEALINSDLDWTIIRPSVVYSLAGSYGGTSLIRSLAALPFILFVPGTGSQRLQPISGEDLGQIVVRSLEDAKCNKAIIEAVSPEAVTFKEYLLSWRKWLGITKPRFLFYVPLWLVKPVAWLGEKLGNGPLGMTMYRMLQRGNVGSPGAYEELVSRTSIQTRSVASVFGSQPSFVQDRWHARLYLVRPLLWLSLVVIWLGSGLVGFVTPLPTSMGFIREMGLNPSLAPMLVYGASTLDIILGLMLLFRVAIPLTGTLMLLSITSYTVLIGATVPTVWLEPFGGILKNIVLIPAVLIMLAIYKVR